MSAERLESAARDSPGGAAASRIARQIGASEQTLYLAPRGSTYADVDIDRQALAIEMEGRERSRLARPEGGSNTKTSPGDRGGRA